MSMHKKRSRKIARVLSLILVAILMATVLTGCGPNEQVEHLTHVTGPLGSGWYPMAVLFNDIWMDKIPGVNLSVLEGGAVANLRAVNRGTAQIGWGFGPDFVDAVKGTGPFVDDGKLENIRILGATYPVWWYFMVPYASKILTFDHIIDAAGTLRLAPGPTAGGTGPTIIDRLVRVHGTTYDQLKADGMRVSYVSYADAANMIRDGLLDIVFLAGAPAVSAISEVDRTVPMRAIPIPEEVLRGLKAGGYGYSIDIPLPVGTYGKQTYEVPTVTQPGILVVHKDMSDELVYQLTEHLWGNLERIRREQPARGNMMSLEAALEGITDLNHLHPGALRFYRERGLVK